MICEGTEKNINYMYVFHSIIFQQNMILCVPN